MVCVTFALCECDLATYQFLPVYRMLLLHSQLSMTAVLLQWSKCRASRVNNRISYRLCCVDTDAMRVFSSQLYIPFRTMFV